MASHVVFLNPRTCGIYKNGAPRFKTDPATGKRTSLIDNELADAVEAYLAGTPADGICNIPLHDIYERRVLVPTYYDERYNAGISALLKDLSVDGVTIGDLVDEATIHVRAGHGSPGNDQRAGHIPYLKVSDIRGLRINVNPTNLVTDAVARRLWRGPSSGLQAWDVLTPNRASSNIGEFAMILPGEEKVVLTKEVFVLRVIDYEVWDAFYLLWSLSLQAVREQWRRIALMQTNREDCGDRYREIILPMPPSKEWAQRQSEAFRAYFLTIAAAKQQFLASVRGASSLYIATVVTDGVPSPLEAPEGTIRTEPSVPSGVAASEDS